MRKLGLIGAFILVSATAQAGVTRGLTLASSDDSAATAAQQPKIVDGAKASDAQKPAETPAYVARPAAVDTSPQPASVATEKPHASLKADRPKRRQESTEARVIYELHRHGIYW
jgi:hypothetical protein